MEPIKEALTFDDVLLLPQFSSVVPANTSVNINLVTEDKILKFRLKNTRKLDRKALNLLRNQQIQAIIN